MTNLKPIADEIYDKEKTKSHRDFIDNYRKHEREIQAADPNSSQETYDIYSQLLADYGIALCGTKSYKKAIPVLNQALDLFQKNKKWTPDTLPNVGFYEALLFNRAVCNYYLDRFEVAKPDFEQLIKLYPENSDYPKWINAFKTRRLYRLRNFLFYILAASTLIVTVFESRTLLKHIFLGIGLVSLVLSVIIELDLFIRKRKYSA